MFKESHLHIEMIIAVLLFPAVYSQRKIDYGIFSACLSKNQSLKVKCYYPACEDNTPFKCDLYDVEENTRKLIGSSDPEMVNRHVSHLNTSGECKLLIKDHATIHHNKTKIYTCCLSRRTSKEEKNLTVQYRDKRKVRPKACRSGGPFLHVSRLLWSMVFLFFQETYL